MTNAVTPQVFTRRTCILCGHSMRRRFAKNGYWIVECEACQHRSTEIQPSDDHVATVYDDSYFNGGGAGYCGYLSDGDLLRKRGRWYAQVVSKFLKPGRVLDVGAAAGFVMQGLTDEGWSGVGIEPNETMAHYGQNELGLDLRVGSLERYRDRDEYDLVSMIQVLPHFYAPHLALESANRLTRAGGFWLIETWDCGSVTARTLGKYWHEYSPPSVLQWFTRAGVETLVSQFGFSKVAWGHPSKRIRGAHARSLLTHISRGAPMGGLIRGLSRVIPENLVLPHLAEDLVWMLFRKQDSAN